MTQEERNKNFREFITLTARLTLPMATFVAIIFEVGLPMLKSSTALSMNFWIALLTMFGGMQVGDFVLRIQERILRRFFHYESE